jgi:hypothetical protein
VTVPGHADHELLEIGRAGDGMRREEILHSLGWRDHVAE